MKRVPSLLEQLSDAYDELLEENHRLKQEAADREEYIHSLVESRDASDKACNDLEARLHQLKIQDEAGDGDCSICGTAVEIFPSKQNLCESCRQTYRGTRGRLQGIKDLRNRFSLGLKEAKVLEESIPPRMYKKILETLLAEPVQPMDSEKTDYFVVVDGKVHTVFLDTTNYDENPF